MLPQLFCIAFVFVMILFLAMHSWMLSHNVTSYECADMCDTCHGPCWRPRFDWRHNRGTSFQNFAEIFGTDPWRWFLPLSNEDHPLDELGSVAKLNLHEVEENRIVGLTAQEEGRQQDALIDKSL